MASDVNGATWEDVYVASQAGPAARSARAMLAGLGGRWTTCLEPSA
jgi:hypothetical protein